MSQSGRLKNYSESDSKDFGNEDTTERVAAQKVAADEPDVVRVETDLVVIPVQLRSKDGKAVTAVSKSEFKIFENGVEQEIAYFSDQDQPFTVALMLDMSYSAVFKLKDIQAAARTFVQQLRPVDRVMVLSFDEKLHILCEPTSDRKILELAIEGTKIASGTSVYKAVNDVFLQRLDKEAGRKAIVILTDGVDTGSDTKATPESVARQAEERDVVIYPIKYDTYDDVQKNRRDHAEVRYDDDDRPYTVEGRPAKGERTEDYSEALNFLRGLSRASGGRMYDAPTPKRLDQAFAEIANELRKIYSLGYYPSGERVPGTKYSIKIRVYRPDLQVRAKASYASSRH